MAKEQADPLDAVENFIERSKGQVHSIYVGIDPGAEGAIAFICGKIVAVIDIPVITVAVKRTKKTTKKEFKKTGNKTKTVVGSTTRYNYGAICKIFRALKDVKDRVVAVCLEDVPTSLGPGKRHAEMMLNRAWAIWPLFLHSKGFTVEDVKPTIWKQSLGLRGKDKESSRYKALSLFPKADINRKKDHGRAEALLIAEFVRRERQRGSKP